MLSGCMSHSISHALSVDFIPPHRNRRAWFCTLLSVARFVSEAVLRAALLYSSVGLRYPMLSCRSALLLAPHFVLASRFTIFSRRLALVAAASICFLVDSFGSSCMPR